MFKSKNKCFKRLESSLSAKLSQLLLNFRIIVRYIVKILYISRVWFHTKLVFITVFFYLNDTQRENLCFTQLSTRIAAWLLLTFFTSLHNQLSSIHSIIIFNEYRCLKKIIHQIDIENEWLLLSASLRQNVSWFLS